MRVVVEVDLDRVALGGDVALAHRGLVGGDVGQDRCARGQVVLPAQQLGDPRPLRLRQRHDRPERLQQPDEEHVGDVRVVTRRKSSTRLSGALRKSGSKNGQVIL
jgi:hypothetical protein